MAGGGPIVVRLQKRALALAASLSFFSGFVDVLTLVLFGEFAALQSGNMVFIGRLIFELTQPHEAATWEEIAHHVAALLSNFSGVVLFCAIHKYCRRPVLVAAPILPVLTASAGAFNLASGGAKWGEWGACFAAASMGALNFISSPNSDLSGKLFAMTSLATGNLQKSAKMFFKWVTCHEFTPAEKQQTLTAVSTVFCTILGAALGGFAMFLKPFGPEDYHDSWYLIIAAPFQLLILLYHNCIMEPVPIQEDAELSTSMATMPTAP